MLSSGFVSSDFHSVNLPGAEFLPGLLTLGQIEIGLHSRRYGLGLVHDPTGSAPLLLTPTKRVVTIHDVAPYVLKDTSTVLDRFIYHLWLPLALPKSDNILTVSNQTKGDLARHFNIPMEKITVIHLAASEHFRPLVEDKIKLALDHVGLSRPYVLYVGSIEPRKNPIRLLEAYAQLRQWSTEWDLVLVGTRNLWKSSPVRKTTEKLNLKPYVHFTGKVPELDLPGIYNGADLFIYPSLYEGFGLPVLEAMACGTPVITSNTSSLPEVAGEAALFVDPYDVEEITAAMRLVLEDSALARDLRERGLDHAKKFSWQKTARQTISVYEKLLGEQIA